jgi:hypothetical protein
VSILDCVQIYKRACQALSITNDWQVEQLLPTKHFVLIHRSLSFNEIHAFTLAIGTHIERLVLHSIGLTSRGVQLLSRELAKCIHLTIVVRSTIGFKNSIRLIDSYFNIKDLSENRFNRQAFDSLVKTLVTLPSLVFVGLSACGIQDSYASDIGPLCSISTIDEIDLSRNELEENACIAIGNALSTLPFVVEILVDNELNTHLLSHYRKKSTFDMFTFKLESYSLFSIGCTLSWIRSNIVCKF